MMKDTDAYIALIEMVIENGKLGASFELLRWLFDKYETAELLEKHQEGDDDNV